MTSYIHGEESSNKMERINNNERRGKEKERYYREREAEREAAGQAAEISDERVTMDKE